MIDFTQETYASLRQEMLDRVPDTYDKRDTAPIPTAISPAAYTLAGFYLSLDQVQRAAFVQTAVGDSLDMLAVIGGLTRYPASARVNGTVAITGLTKTVEGSELTVTYTIMPSQATEITALELLDAEGNILTSSTVYIPVTTNVVLKHIIPVAEGVVSNG